MAIPPMNLPPESAAWGRWVQRNVDDAVKQTTVLSTNADAVNQHLSSTGNAVARTGNSVVAVDAKVDDAARRPAIPTNIVYSSVIRWNDKGYPVADIAGTWDEVSSGADGEPMPVGQYEAWWKPDANPDTDYVRLAATTVPSLAVIGFNAGLTINIKLRACSSLGVMGDFSEPQVVTLGLPDATTLAPSAPTLSTALGVVTAHWDGKLSNGTTAPVQFSFASAYVSDTQSGTYKLVGQSVIGAGDIVLTDLPIGSTKWVKLALTDRIGRPTPLSAAASIAVLGVDLGGLQSDVTNAIQSAQDAGDAGKAAAATAQSAADSADAKAAQALLDSSDAQTAASNAQTTAGNASTTANTALSTANGKNKVIFSTSAASGTTGYVAGDIWFQKSGSIIVGQWEFVSGAWAARTLDNAVIANLDAGKLTAGTISVDRLGASSITVDKLLVGDPTNLAQLDETAGVNVNAYGSDSEIVGGWARRTDASKGTAFFMLAVERAVIPFEPGDRLLFTFDVYAEAAFSALEQVWLYRESDHSNINGNAGFAVTTTPQTISVVVTAPTYVRGDYNKYIIGLNGVAGHDVRIRRVRVVRMTGSTLITDGAITTNKIVAGSITAASGILADAVITNAKIADLAVNNAKINDVSGNKITARTITADRIGANQITANEIATGTITANEIKGGTITGTQLSGTAIDGKTITGATIRTAASGQRVELTTAGIKGYDSTGTVKTSISTTGVLFAVGADITGAINATSGTISGNLSVTGSLTGGTFQTASTGQRAELSGTGVTFYAPNNYSAKITAASNGASGQLLNLTAGTGTLAIGSQALPVGSVAGSIDSFYVSDMRVDKLTFANNGNAVNPYVMSGGTAAISASGFTTITFPVGLFSAPPVVTTQITATTGSAVGVVWEGARPTTTSFQAALFTLGGARVAGEIQWIALSIVP